MNTADDVPPVLGFYRLAFNSVVPIPERPLTDGAKLAELIAVWNATSERRWSAMELNLYAETSRGATSQQRVDARNAWVDLNNQSNTIARSLNPYLESVCVLPPLDPYAK
jgi:hypothetical protein